jgi:curved DNA-binding protein CbpA
MVTPSGDIKDMTVPWLFQDLRLEQGTGTVVFSRESAVKKVYVKAGEIIYASSNLDADQMGSCLVANGKLSQEQHAVSLEAAQRTGKPLGAVLIERGFLAPQDLVSGAKLQVKQIVQSLFPWRDGRYAFSNGALPLTEIIPLQIPTGSLLFEGIRDLDWKIVRKSLPPLKTVLKPSTNAPLLLKGIELEPDHRAVLTLADGSKSIEELCVLSEIGDFSTLKALYVLIALRLMEIGGAKTAEEIKQAVQHIVAEEKQATAKETQETKAAETRVSREMIQHAFDSIGIQDYYQILGVGRSATVQEIRKAYLSLAKVYHPDRHIDTELADMKVQLEALFANITEANNILGVSDKRDKYNLDLASGLKKYGKEKIRTAEEDNKKSTAIAQFNEGQKQLRIQNFWGAEEAFRWAARLDPGNAEYVFHQGLALARIPRRGHEAQEYFEKAVELAPSHTEYYLELGNFYSKHGQKAKALSTYHDALARDPGSEKIKQAIANAGSHA